MAVTLPELPNGSALRSRSKPGDHGANGITVTNHAVTEDAVQGEDPSKVRKTFGRTPDKGEYPLCLVMANALANSFSIC